MSRPVPAQTITPELVLRAYAAGLFPMAENADDPRLFWVDPEHRGVFPLDGITVSRSLRKVVRSDRFTIDFDQDFDAVIDGCAASARGRAQTWINTPIRRLYRTLFDRGSVHTVEARRGATLVGGLYGLSIGGAFFGESMFHRETDASKVCLIHLAAGLVQGGFTLLDAQFVTPHLATLGAVEVPRAKYHMHLARAVARSAHFPSCPRDGGPAGAEVLETLDQARAHLLPAGSRPPNSVE